MEDPQDPVLDHLVDCLSCYDVHRPTSCSTGRLYAALLAALAECRQPTHSDYPSIDEAMFHRRLVAAARGFWSRLSYGRAFTFMAEREVFVHRSHGVPISYSSHQYERIELDDASDDGSLLMQRGIKNDSDLLIVDRLQRRLLGCEMPWGSLVLPCVHIEYPKYDAASGNAHLPFQKLIIGARNRSLSGPLAADRGRFSQPIAVIRPGLKPGDRGRCKALVVTLSPRGRPDGFRPDFLRGPDVAKNVWEAVPQAHPRATALDWSATPCLVQQIIWHTSWSIQVERVTCTPTPRVTDAVGKKPDEPTPDDAAKAAARERIWNIYFQPSAATTEPNAPVATRRSERRVRARDRAAAAPAAAPARPVVSLVTLQYMRIHKSRRSEAGLKAWLERARESRRQRRLRVLRRMRKTFNAVLAAQLFWKAREQGRYDRREEARRDLMRDLPVTLTDEQRRFADVLIREAYERGAEAAERRAEEAERRVRARHT